MNIRSAKAKGARLVKELRKLLLDAFPDRLVEGDLCVTAASVPGPDLYLSPKARDLLNMQFECKNQERFNIHTAIKQAQGHCKAGEVPVVVFRRNHEPAKAVVPLEFFVKLLVDAKREVD